MRRALIAFVLCVSVANAATMTVNTAVTHQTISGFMVVPSLPGGTPNVTDAYIDDLTTALSPEVHNGKFKMAGLQWGVFPGDMVGSTNSWTQFRAGTLTPSTGWSHNWGECPANGGTYQGDRFRWDYARFYQREIADIVAAGNTPVFHLRMNMNQLTGASANCPGSNVLPSYYTPAVFAAGYVALLDDAKNTLGLHPDANWHLTVVNEPDRHGLFSDTQLGTYSAALRTALNAAGYSAVGIDCGEYGYLPSLTAGIATIVSNAGAGVCSAATTHPYSGVGTTDIQNAYNAAAAVGLPIMMTEYTDLGGPSAFNFLKYGFTGWEKFVLGGPQGAGTCPNGVDYPTGGSDACYISLGAACNTPYTAAYCGGQQVESAAGYLAQYTNAKLPGAVVTDCSSNTGSYQCLGFIRADGTHAIIIDITATGTLPAITINGVKADTYSTTYTLDNSNAQVSLGTQTCGGGTACSITLPSVGLRAVVTMAGNTPVGTSPSLPTTGAAALRSATQIK